MVVVGLMKKMRRRMLLLLNSNRYKRYHALEGDDDDEGCDSDGHDHDPSQQHYNFDIEMHKTLERVTQFYKQTDQYIRTVFIVPIMSIEQSLTPIPLFTT